MLCPVFGRLLPMMAGTTRQQHAVAGGLIRKHQAIAGKAAVTKYMQLIGLPQLSSLQASHPAILAACWHVLSPLLVHVFAASAIAQVALIQFCIISTNVNCFIAIDKKL